MDCPEKCLFDRRHRLCKIPDMTATLENITRQVMQLPARQRLALAGFLLEMDDSAEHSETNEAWEREIQSRIRAVDGGTMSGIPYSDVMREADSRLAP
jgi:predicted GTPase